MKPAIYLPPENDSPVINSLIKKRNIKDTSGMNPEFSVAFFGFLLLLLVQLAYIAYDRIEHNYLLNRIAGK